MHRKLLVPLSSFLLEGWGSIGVVSGVKLGEIGTPTSIERNPVCTQHREQFLMFTSQMIIKYVLQVCYNMTTTRSSLLGLTKLVKTRLDIAVVFPYSDKLSFKIWWETWKTKLDIMSRFVDLNRYLNSHATRLVNDGYWTNLSFDPGQFLLKRRILARLYA